MSSSAIFVMILGMIILWGGLAASVGYAIMKARAKKEVPK